MTDRLIDADEFAAMLGIGRASFFRRKSEGAIPDASRIGTRCVRWLLAEVQCWMRKDMPDAEIWRRIRSQFGFGIQGGK